MPFRDVAGHGSLLDLIARAAVRRTLPPSLIFAGPDGVGKRLSAVALAQIVNCPTPRTDPADACGVCPSCTRIARGVHADVLIIQPGDTGSIKVDQIRDAVERTAYRPFEGRRRVVIFDDADAIAPEAQNALLKTLEEPPPGSMFVLVASCPDLLLPTVRSRCQRIRFGRLAAAEVARVLIDRHGYAEPDARAAATFSGGSIGRALEEATDDAAEARAAAVRMLQGIAGSADVRRRLDSAKALAGQSDRHELARRLEAVSSILRDVGLLLARADERHVANTDLGALLAALQRTFDGERALRAFSAVDRALAALDRNASPKIVADWLALQI